MLTTPSFHPSPFLLPPFLFLFLSPLFLLLKGEYVALTVKRVLFGQRRAHLRALWKGFHAGVGGRTLDTQLSQMSAEDLSYVFNR